MTGRAFCARRVAAAVLATVVAGCASVDLPAGHPPTGQSPHGRGNPSRVTHGGAWPLAALVEGEGRWVGVSSGDRIRWFDAAAVRAAWAAVRRVEAAGASARPQYHLIDDPAANAFALHTAQGPVIGIHVGMLELLGDDEAAWAALIGHELAHLDLRHAESQRSRRNGTGGLVAVASVLLTFVGFPLTPIFAEFATSMAEKGYSRDDERAADEAGIALMRRAGYDPAGAVRFFEKLAASGQSDRFAFLSTHPDGTERIAAARAFAGHEPD